jgi:para-aminobenzoate synthetase/4-amino-4-deoxychorismate lyase
VGAVWPDGRAQFNVAIRTAVIDHERERATFGVGSGIVWDSDAGDEYQECLTKGLVFGASPRPFSLLETVRWSPGDGVFLLDRHLERLQRSAQYFGFSYHEDRLRRALDTAVSGQTAPLRLRWLIGPDGDVRIESAPFRRMSAPARVRLASEPVNPDQVFLYHKTTARDVYDRARQDGCDDTILWNVRGEITEATTANVVAELRGRRVTPPVSCGLLAGTFRADLLARGDIEEGVITPGDLREATSVWLINSVQEWRSAVVAWER